MTLIDAYEGVVPLVVAIPNHEPPLVVIADALQCRGVVHSCVVYRLTSFAAGPVCW